MRCDDRLWLCKPHMTTVAWIAVWLMSLAGVGCGRPSTMVTGTVTVDGQPLDKAIVQFQPERANDRPAVVLTDAQGYYRVGVSPVPFRVVIHCQRIVGERKEGTGADGVVIDTVEDVVPEKYMRGETTPLRVEPEAGGMTVADFALPGRK